MIWLRIVMSGAQNIPLARIVAVGTLTFIGEVITTSALTLRLFATTTLRPTVTPAIPFAHFVM